MTAQSDEPSASALTGACVSTSKAVLHKQPANSIYLLLGLVFPRMPPTIIPKGLYVSRTSSDGMMDMSVKLTTVPVRQRSRKSSASGGLFGIQCPRSNLELSVSKIAYPFIQHRMPVMSRP